MRAGRRSAPGVGWLKIESVEVVELDGLTDTDAAADGFPTRAGLVEALEGMYPDHAGDGRRWFLVRFVLDRVEPPRAQKPNGQGRLFTD